MSIVTNIFSVSINTKPEDVFAYVSDLTKHNEWNDGLKVEAMTGMLTSEMDKVAQTIKQFIESEVGE